MRIYARKPSFILQLVRHENGSSNDLWAWEVVSPKTYRNCPRICRRLFQRASMAVYCAVVSGWDVSKNL